MTHPLLQKTPPRSRPDQDQMSCVTARHEAQLVAAFISSTESCVCRLEVSVCLASAMALKFGSGDRRGDVEERTGAEVG
eukprot:CAMPEP_0175880126 /NCGR_PEP_ID=MMETSP0107_2-20121207/42147_1 /TAXON_ID=195067 ORGANISM="Goniomonas pacifica, Strain CCMP1869" /NCGR_SAMPLE_ID=MMETSP0107_2 /ASSEMBLY_ACC=CAM_ASM_000203 /LENGTH=78 /DNA_ID=CAMNT_0017199841 /DNA_START=63 /DNA_END=296 /DNA_ORIENTATION=-